MKKQISFILFILALLFFTSCAREQKKEEKQPAVIIGRYYKADSRIYLNKVHAGSVRTIDSVDLREDTAFVFMFRSPDYALFRLEHKDLYHLIVVARNGDTVRVTQTDDPAWPYRVEGNEECMLVAGFLERLNRDEHKVDSLSAIFHRSQSHPDFLKIRDRLNQGFIDIHEGYKEYARDFIHRHPSSFASLIMINSFFREFLLFDQMEDFEYYEIVADAVMERMPENRYARELHDHVEKIRKANEEEMEAEIRLAPGMIIPDFQLEAEGGIKVGPRDLRGRPALLYLWAATDAKSRQVNPLIKKAHDTYFKHGLLVMTISFDRVPETWQAALKLDSLPGYHLNEPLGPGSPLHKLLNLKRQLPAYFLLDQNSRIFSHSKDFSNLQQDLYDLFNNPLPY